MPAISVIVPVYNTEKYLKFCLEGLQNQTFTDYEVIMIDDGSTDHSAEILDQAASLDSRIQIIHQNNAGAAHARNEGLKCCKGQYICFVDADDVIHPEYLEVLYTAAVQTKCDIVQCGFQNVTEEIFQEEKCFSKENLTMSQTQFFQPVEVLQRIYSKNYIGTVVLWNKIYKSDIIRDLRAPEGIMFEDEVFSAQVIYRANRIAIIPNVLYFYYHNDSGVMNSAYSVRMLEILTALQMRMDFYKKENLEDLYLRDSYKFLYKTLLNYNEVIKLKDHKKSILKDLKKNYWKKYRECIHFPWSLKRKVMMLFFGIFPKHYTDFYNKRNQKSTNSVQ